MTNSNPLTKATHEGLLRIGESIIDSAVLEGGTRVLARISVIRAIGRTGKAKGGRRYDNESKIPVFLSANNLKPFISKALLENSTPIPFRTLKGGDAIGYKAEILPQICNVFLDAQEKGVLLPNQMHIYEQCKKLIRGFATIGIIALVDEATGFQKERNEYQKILELYIAKDIQPWIHTFEDNYYKQLYRLQGWNWDAFKNKKRNHPQYIGKLTNRLIYEKLAPGILQELRRINPIDNKGNRKTKHFQRLTENIGYRELLKLLASVTILMEQFSDGDLTGAIQKIDARFPSFSPLYQTSMDFPVVADKKVFDSVIEKIAKPEK